jgi:DNA-directed RNA polymerase sigma subunit (sigma70/sigma32)
MKIVYNEAQATSLTFDKVDTFVGISLSTLSFNPHRDVIILHFGIRDGDEKKHAQISEELGIPKDLLKDIKKEALRMLKEKLGSENPFNSEQ